jgi:hypothetical protein
MFSSPDTPPGRDWCLLRAIASICVCRIEAFQQVRWLEAPPFAQIVQGVQRNRAGHAVVPVNDLEEHAPTIAARTRVGHFLLHHAGHEL